MANRNKFSNSTFAVPAASTNGPALQSRKPPNAWGRNSPSVRSPPPQQQQSQQQQPPTTTSPPPGPALLPTPIPINNFPPLGAPVAPANKPVSDAPPSLLSNFQSLAPSTPISLFTRTGVQLHGIFLSVGGPPGGETIHLGSLKPNEPAGEKWIKIADVEAWSGPPPPQNSAFKTDTDISRGSMGGRERLLEPWMPPPDSGGTTAYGSNAGDDITFGPGHASGKSWDQFAANEEKFGIHTSFDESVYTTTIDRSKPGFREREREAARIADEIMGSTTNNPHVAEERGRADDSGMNEEDRYGAVVRGAGAYIPPGARRSTDETTKAGTPTAATPPPKEKKDVKFDLKEDKPNGDAKPIPTIVAQPPTDGLVSDFRQFVTTEKNRLTQKKAAMAKSDMEKRKAELVSFSQSFKLNKPIPDDLVSILTKDSDKQREIKEKSLKDAHSGVARAIGPSITASAPVAPHHPIPPPQSAKKPTAPTPVNLGKGSVPPPTAVPTSSSSRAPAPTMPSTTNATPVKKPKMFLQAIPAFNPNKIRLPGATPGPSSVTSMTTSASISPVGNEKDHSVSGIALKESNTMPANNVMGLKGLSVNAPSFKPGSNGKGVTSASGSASGSTSASPKTDAVQSPPNPFFGTRVPKKSAPVHVKEDFNPFKRGDVPAASSIAAMWNYSGKRYIALFPPAPSLAHQPPAPSQQGPPPAQAPHIPPLPMGMSVSVNGPPVPPPQGPSYDESSAPQPGGYVYYPVFPYPGQMVPGMGAPPPGYIPAPYMQPIAYQPGMGPPPGGPPMYAHMGAMPPAPPPHFMPQPGPYAPPPNGNRPSMPPTPVPAHAHPYPYHQSPQLQHAVPYPIMMHPPGAPHNVYEATPGVSVNGGNPNAGGQPVAMGNHS